MTNINVTDVPETDAEVYAKLDKVEVEAATPANSPTPETPEAPKAEVEAEVKAEEVAPAKPAPIPNGNSAYAPEADRQNLAALLAELKEKGWTRPSISALTGFSDSQVWRAQNKKVHTVELDFWVQFLGKVKSGEFQPPTSGRKPKVEDLQAQLVELERTHAEALAHAIEVLSSEAKTAAQYRKLVDDAKALLSA